MHKSQEQSSAFYPPFISKSLTSLRMAYVLTSGRYCGIYTTNIIRYKIVFVQFSKHEHQ